MSVAGLAGQRSVRTTTPPAARLLSMGLFFGALALMLVYCLIDIERTEVYRNNLVLWQDAVSKQPEDAMSRNNLGKAFASVNRLNDAIGELRKAVQLNPRFAEALYNLGTALNQAGSSREALEMFDRVVAIRPYDAIAHNNAGKVWLKLGNPAAALGRYEKAIYLDPSYAKAYFNLAIASAQLNQRAQADAAAAAALQLAWNQGNSNLAEAIEAWLAKYRASEGDSPAQN